MLFPLEPSAWSIRLVSADFIAAVHVSINKHLMCIKQRMTESENRVSNLFAFFFFRRGTRKVLLLGSIDLALMGRALIVLLLVVAVCLGHALAADRLLAFSLKQRNLDTLEKLFWERSNPDHADYGKCVLLSATFTTCSHSFTA